MRNIFSYEFNKDKEIIKFNGEKFITKRISQLHDTKIDMAIDKLYSFYEQASVPKYIRVVKFMLAFAVFQIIISIAIEAISSTVQTVYETSAYKFYFASACIIILLFFIFFEVYKKLKVSYDADFLETEAEAQYLAKISELELEIPENREYIDVLCYAYYVKSNREKPVRRSFKYSNSEFCLYKKKECICFTDSSMEVSFNISSIKAINRINKKTKIIGWNKEESYNSYLYRSFKITQTDTNTDIYNLKEYYAIVINVNCEDFEVLIPNYDIDKVIKLLK